MKTEWIIKSILLMGIPFGIFVGLATWNLTNGLLVGLFAMVYYLVRRPMLDNKDNQIKLEKKNNA